ncbi:MAG TPA: oxygen-independent coproporphyrinogen III oxidase [Myxococcota bacterium]|jgi:oxygen-independent coproporphyrinogen-3 oxidase|nr:oxygen-independent coproporphyrinogen III oxidase [Myxococcota bacterium]
MSGAAGELDFERAQAILPRYEGPGPRYTSYPTAPVWTEAFGAADFLAELARADASAEEPIALYAHVPFCASLCHFCACNRIITRDAALPESYLDVIAREIAFVREQLAVPRRASQLHWGGGTPTHLAPAQIRRLFHAMVDAFPLRSGAEVSIEVDPRVTTEAQIETLRELGFTRISMGVQDFDPRVQEAIHRVQPVAQTARLVELARRAGFESVNFDLIYGLPFQREESFGRTLDAVRAIGPDRIALYSYAHVTWVAKQQRGFERKDLPDARTKLGLLLLGIRRLTEAGYAFIGMDHFARPEDELSRALRERTLRRNFMGYTTQAGVELLGFGPSAISQLRDAYAQSARELAAWSDAVRTRGVATIRGHRLGAEDQRRRFVIERILCHGAVDPAEVDAAFGGSFARDFAGELARLEPLEIDGLVTRERDGRLGVTPLGRLLVRNVAMVFDAYLPEQQRSGRARFSKAV